METTVRVWGGRLLLATAACLAFLLLAAVPSYAQVDTGSILGTVSDSSGARVKGATVTLTNEGTNAELSSTTGDDGGYKFTPVRIGTYKLTVTNQGFQTTTTHGVTVNVGENVVADFSLKPGAVSETVEVTTSAPVLQSQDICRSTAATLHSWRSSLLASTRRRLTPAAMPRPAHSQRTGRVRRRITIFWTVLTTTRTR